MTMCSLDGVLFSKDYKTIILYPHNKKGTEYILPEKTQKISMDAFNCVKNLKKIVIPAGVKKIKEATFCGCDKLTDLVLKSSKTQISEASEIVFKGGGRRISVTEKKMVIKAPQGSPAIKIAEKYKKVKFVTIQE